MENGRKRNVARGNERSSGRVAFAGYLLLATGLAFLSGCVTTDKAKVVQREVVAPSPAAAQPAPPVPAGPSVTHLTNGREGFVIKEPAAMDAGMRASFDRATAMIREAKYDQSVELLEKVIAGVPGLTAPLINAAIAYGRLDKPEEAELHLLKALDLIPGHPVASNEYGLLLRKAGRFAESRLIYEKSLAAFPEYSPLHKNLAILCDLYLRDVACAIGHYDSYARAVPKEPQVKLWIADLQNRVGSTMTASVKGGQDAAAAR